MSGPSDELTQRCMAFGMLLGGYIPEDRMRDVGAELAEMLTEARVEGVKDGLQVAVDLIDTKGEQAKAAILAVHSRIYNKPLTKEEVDKEWDKLGE